MAAVPTAQSRLGQEARGGPGSARGPRRGQSEKPVREEATATQRNAIAQGPLPAARARGLRGPRCQHTESWFLCVAPAAVPCTLGAREGVGGGSALPGTEEERRQRS